MTATMILVRHAAHDDVGAFLAGRLPGIRLGEAGRAQAERLANRLADEPFEAIHASPRERTQETAAAVAARHAGMAVTISAALDEIDFGAWSGHPFDALNQDPEWRRWNAARSLTRTPAGEGMRHVTERVMGLIEGLASAHPDGAIVLVSHADVIRAALLHVLGLPVDAWPRIEIAPASISKIAFDPWGARVTLVNERVDPPEDRSPTTSSSGAGSSAAGVSDEGGPAA